MATTVEFGSDLVVDEETGNAWLEVRRSGDLTTTVNVEVYENWPISSAETDDIIFNPHVAGSNILYLSSLRNMILSFAPGVKSIKIPYSISNDITEEASERLYFGLREITSGVTIGDNAANIKINASDPVISVYGGLLVEEGNSSQSYIELSRAVNFDVAVRVSTYYGTYKQANYLGEGGDYKGLVDQVVVILAGKTRAYVPVLTYQNPDPNDWLYESTEIRIEANSVPSGVLLGHISDIITIGDVAITPSTVSPTLTLYDGGLAYENESSHSYAKLSHVVDYDVTFKVSTYFGTYKQANYLGEGKDYVGLLDEAFIIYAGTDRVEIPVKILQNLDPNDWEYEAFELRIEAPTVSGATLDVGSVIINIKDVSTWTPPLVTVTPLTAVMLANHKQAFLNLESEVGTSSAVAIIGGNKELSNVGKTLDFFGMLSSGIKNAVNWFVGSTAYANQEELPLFSLTQKQINIGLRLMSPVNPEDIFAPDPIEWTTEEVNQIDGLGLRVGDYVDGRLVIHQPWMALKSDGSYVSSSSLQGRYGGPDNLSHKEEIKNSFDWSGVSKYAVVPVDSYVVAFDDSGNIGSFNNGLGNFVTLKAINKTSGGKDIYLTFAHLKQGTVGGVFKQSSVKPIFVPAGTIIGETGQTGSSETDKYAPYGYAVHLHMQAGTALENLYGNSRYADADIDEIPPVYMLGFNSSNVATMDDLGSEDRTGNFVVQDYGFPIGDSDGGEKNVASNIIPTIPISDFHIANPFFININVVQGDSGDNHFTGGYGDDMYLGKGGYDQVNYFGPTSNRSNFTVTQNPDGTIKIVSAEFGTDTLDNIEGVWFDNQFKWYTIEDLLNPIKTYFTTPTKPVLEGTSVKEIFIGDSNVNWFIGNGGGDTYNGNGEYDQVEYYGPDAYRSNFIFSNNLDGSVTAVSPYGREIYIDIEGVWFGTEQAWYSVDSLTFI